MKQIFNRIFSAFLAVLLCVGLFVSVATPVSAASGTCGENITWTLENGVLTLSGTGPMYSYTEHNMAPWLENADRIQRIVVQQGVTQLSQLAFYGCTNLTSVSLADSVQVVGDMAFASCTGLRQITMGGVERLERRCFYNCHALSNVILPQSLRYLGDEVFFSCKSLGGITIPSGVEYMGSGLFSYCDGLAAVFVEAPLQELPTWSFYGCDALTQLHLPSTVTEVGNSALTGCDNLYHVDYSGSAAVADEIERQLDEPSAPTWGPTMQKDVTYSQTDNAVITTTNKTQTGGSAITPTEQEGTFVEATVTGSSGWSSVTQTVTDTVNSGRNPQVDVQLQQDTTVPEGALSDLLDQNVTVTVQTQDNVQWQINMKDQTTDALKEEQQLDAKLTGNASGAYSDTLGDATSYTVTLGSTSVNSTILLPLGNETARQVATLYSKKGKKLEKLTSVVVDDQGRAAFSLAGTKAGEYVVALDVKTVSSEEVVIPQALAKDYDITYGATLTDSQGNQYVLTGRVNKLGISLGTLTWIIVGVLLGSTVLIGVIMTVWNKQQQKYRRKRR